MDNIKDIIDTARQIGNVISVIREDVPGMIDVSVRNSAICCGKNYIGIIIINRCTHRIEISRMQMEEDNYMETVQVAKELSQKLSWKIQITRF
jgi:hypothetical protein